MSARLYGKPRSTRRTWPCEAGDGCAADSPRRADGGPPGADGGAVGADGHAAAADRALLHAADPGGARPGDAVGASHDGGRRADGSRPTSTSGADGASARCGKRIAEGDIIGSISLLPWNIRHRRLASAMRRVAASPRPMRHRPATRAVSPRRRPAPRSEPRSRRGPHGSLRTRAWRRWPDRCRAERRVRAGGARAPAGS